MKSPKVYKTLYYISLIFTMMLSLVIIHLKELMLISNGLFGINIILVIIFSLSLTNKKLNNVNNLFPILYLTFLAIIMIETILYNPKLIIPYIHFDYFITFILFDYLLLNIYSFLSLKRINK